MNRKGQFNAERSFGIEIECLKPRNFSNSTLKDRLSSDFIFGGSNGWKIVGDVTVTSHVSTHSGSTEIVSPPLKGSSGLEEIKRMFAALNELNIKVNKSCGMHVHHDINEWKRMSNRSGFLNIAVKKVKYLLAIIGRYERAIYSVLPKSRLEGTYSMPIKNCYNEEFHKDHISSSKWSGSDRSRNQRIRSFLRRRNGSIGRFQYTRYCGVNFHAYHRQGTVEFRHGAGTVDAQKAINWIVFTQLFVNMADIRSDQNRRIRMATEEPYMRTADRKKSLGHMKVVLGITKSGMDARQGIVRDDLVKGLDAWLTERQNKFASNWGQNGYGGRTI